MDCSTLTHDADHQLGVMIWTDHAPFVGMQMPFTAITLASNYKEQHAVVK